LFLGHLLATTLGVGGQRLARIDKQSATGKRVNESRELYDALSQLV
jgi:hypothetical protein